MFSIIIPLYNKENVVSATLRSVLNQTCQDFEIVVVNDGSTDKSVDVVRSFNDRRIRIVNQENGGVSTARNRGIAEAGYDFLSFIDADDIWEADYLETQKKMIERFPECSVFACNYFLKQIGKERVPAKILGLKSNDDMFILDNYFEVASRAVPPLWTSAVVVRKEAIVETGGFMTGVKSGEDLLAWARLAIKNKIAFCRHPKAVYMQGFSNPRLPEDVDLIGRQFEELYRTNRNVSFLRKYVSFWYKMRMCRCIGSGMYGKAFIAYVKSMRWNPFQLGIYPTIIRFLMNR